jgi:hypothetical protein
VTGPLLEWASSGRPFRDQIVSGDRAVVNVNGRAALCAVVDGLGHGADAAAAAERAVEAIGGATAADPTLLERCHAALAATRGVALSAAAFDGDSGSLTWLGVGNVEGRIVRVDSTGGAERGLLLSPGIVGHLLPPLRPQTVPIARGDLLLVATDGVNPSFADRLPPGGPCAAIARGVLCRHGRQDDDALVLVARYLGDGP